MFQVLFGYWDVSDAQIRRSTSFLYDIPWDLRTLSRHYIPTSATKWYGISPITDSQILSYTILHNVE